MNSENKVSTNNLFINFILEKLSQITTNDLKGFDAQKKASPLVNGLPFRRFKPDKNAKHSSVLLILTENESKFNVLFTLRSADLLNHKGQISFPGGRVEDNETYLETALRETEEEIGVNRENLQILFALSTLYVQPSNSIIHPFAAFLSKKVDFLINPTEVEEVFQIEIDFFRQKDNFHIENWKFGNENVLVPNWKIHPKQVLWGATAMILSEFLDIYEDCVNFVI